MNPKIGNSPTVIPIGDTTVTEGRTLTIMKTLAEQTEKVGIGSEKTMTKNVGAGTPVVGDNVSSSETITAAKKKVRVVKKIVKKKVIKKVPKRASVAISCTGLGKAASSSPNDDVHMEIEDFLLVEIEKANVVVDDSRKGVNTKEFEVREDGKGVCLVENVDSCSDECERSGLAPASLLGDQNGIELHDREHDINTMDVEEHECDGVKEQGDKSSKMDVGVSKGTQGEETVKEQAEDSEYVGVKMEVGLSNDVKGEEGMKEQVEKREHIDLKPSDSVEGQEGVKELIENNETDGSGVEQCLCERRVLNGEMETLEKQMRGSTEIFVNGLDPQTKEEDIRKVFEEVGEVIGVRLITNHRTGKSRGFCFVRYASAADAKLALMKYHDVEIRGRPCRTAAVEGDGRILINNIDKKWNSEYVLALLQKIGIKKIDKVSVVADPENTELNRGFAFLELETKKDAQIAYCKLQNKNVFGKHSKIKVAWVEPSVDQDEEVTHNVKSVYAEHIPSSWNEEEVNDHFKIFGEIESIALAKNLRTSKRKDFAFINYKSREAALSCIKAWTCEESTNDNGPKAHLKVSLSKSIPKGKQIKTVYECAVSKLSKVKRKTTQAVFKPHKPRNTTISSMSGLEDARTDGGSSTTAELVQLLREQASWKIAGTGASNGGYHPSPRGNRLFPELGTESLYHDPRAYHQNRLEIHNAGHPRSIANGVAMISVPHYNQQRAIYTSRSLNGVEANPRYFQTRDQATYHGSNSMYRRMY